MTIRESLLGKNSKERARMKVREIAKLRFLRKLKRGALELKILDIKECEDCIEVFARAWRNGKQIGFGKDVGVLS